ncbi:RNA recognition motif domain, eukaryote, Nucleotide-binding alpha-beta plait domain protein [Artemisia annua]|uniref:RNA recognition motif domain, eukaryote, Nucleotide-binding alpha-beta plait domain protein n=1 Tax=Artemisia annua TaxID=35608 RepID=A0A2U1QNT4_ARTAN|nr:RNA recognition motif domain, eukaryote, Nucleotide-binding alpha-beta plait domain protein [Artemisia annua]
MGHRKWIGSMQIRCNWAAKGSALDDQPRSNTQIVGKLTNGTSDRNALKLMYMSCLE